MGFPGCMVLRARSRCVEIQRSSSVCREMQVVGGLNSHTQCLKARRVSGSAGRTVTACCGELGGKATKVVKRLFVFSGYCAPKWGKSRTARQDASALAGKSSRVVALGASMLLSKCQPCLRGDGELFLLPDLGRGGSRSTLVRLQQNLRRICPAVVVCCARYPRWGTGR